MSQSAFNCMFLQQGMKEVLAGCFRTCKFVSSPPKGVTSPELTLFYWVRICSQIREK